VPCGCGIGVRTSETECSAAKSGGCAIELCAISGTVGVAEPQSGQTQGPAGVSGRRIQGKSFQGFRQASCARIDSGQGAAGPSVGAQFRGRAFHPGGGIGPVEGMAEFMGDESDESGVALTRVNGLEESRRIYGVRLTVDRNQHQIGAEHNLRAPGRSLSCCSSLSLPPNRATRHGTGRGGVAAEYRRGTALSGPVV